MENVHEGLKRFKCDKCAQKFTEKKALTLHIKGVHEKIKEFNCDRCSKKFSKGYNLKVHVQTVHEKERNFICQICKKDLVYQKPYKNILPEHITNNFEKNFPPKYNRYRRNPNLSRR